MNKKVVFPLAVQIVLYALLFLNLPQLSFVSTFAKPLRAIIKTVSRVCPDMLKSTVQSLSDLLDLSNPAGGLLTSLLAFTLLAAAGYAGYKYFIEGREYASYPGGNAPAGSTSDDPWLLPQNPILLIALSIGGTGSLVTGIFMFTEDGTMPIWWVSLFMTIPAIVVAIYVWGREYNQEMDSAYFANRIMVLTLIAGAAGISGVLYSGIIRMVCLILLVFSVYKKLARFLDAQGYQAMHALRMAGMISLFFPVAVFVTALTAIILLHDHGSKVSLVFALVSSLVLLGALLFGIILSIMGSIRLRRSIFLGRWGRLGAVCLIIHAASVLLPSLWGFGDLVGFLAGVTGWALITYALRVEEVRENIAAGAQMVPPPVKKLS